MLPGPGTYDGARTLSLQSCSCSLLSLGGRRLRLPGSFLPWHHVLPLSRTVYAQKTRPNETSVLASAPTCNDSTYFSNPASSNKELGYTQNFGKKSEKRRDEWGATCARQTTELSLSFFWTRNERAPSGVTSEATQHCCENNCHNIHFHDHAEQTVKKDIW